MDDGQPQPPFQFTLGQLLLLVTFFAIGLGMVISMINRGPTAITVIGGATTIGAMFGVLVNRARAGAMIAFTVILWALLLLTFLQLYRDRL